MAERSGAPEPIGAIHYYFSYKILVTKNARTYNIFMLDSCHRMDKSSQLQKREAELARREGEIREILRHLSELGFFSKNYRTGEVTPNRMWQEWGYSPEDMIGDRWLSAVHPEDRERIAADFRSQAEGPDPFSQSEYRVRTGDGGYRWILSKAIVVSRDRYGRPEGYLGTDSDITELKKVEEELRKAKSEAEVRAQEAETLRRAGAVIASTLHRDEAVRLVLQEARRVVAYSAATVQAVEDGALRVIGVAGDSDLRLGSLIDPATVEQYRAILEEGAVIVERNRSPATPDCLGGVSTTAHWLGLPLRNRGRTVGIMTILTSEGEECCDQQVRLAIAFADYVGIAIENARLYERTRQLAVTDELTGLPTRRWFFPHGEHQLEEARRFGESVSLLVIDLDHFKRVNDEHGHQSGDQLLKEVAHLIKEELRGIDALCRFGGEEFLALLPRTNLQGAMKVAERLRSRIAGATSLAVTASIGVSEASLEPSESCELEILIQEADRAMYAAKALGRNRVCHH